MTSTPRQSIQSIPARSTAHTSAYSTTILPAGRNYQNFSSAAHPPNASESITMSTAIGGPPVAHGHNASVNGQNTTMPAIPAVNGGSTQTDHSRKPSMTITPAGATGYAPNGGAVGGSQSKPSNIQFGSINASGSPAHGSQPAFAHQSSNPSVSSLNPRLASPQNSPSPIPQPATVSGGKPPPALQGPGNGFSFGQFEGGDSNVSCALTVSTSG